LLQHEFWVAETKVLQAGRRWALQCARSPPRWPIKPNPPLSASRRETAF